MAEEAEFLRKKSPRAPTMALGEALERVGKIYEMDRLHPAQVDVAARHMGFKGANSGTALSAIASLRYYGLLDRPRDGMVAVSKDFEAYKYAPSEQLRSAFLRRFLTAPPLFAELVDRFGSKLPSDETLTYELIQRAFIPASALSVVGVFRRSFEFVDMQTKDDAPPVEQHEPVPMVPRVSEVAKTLKQDDPSSFAPNFAPSASPKNAALEEDESDRIPVRLSGGRKAWLVIPQTFLQADKERLKAQIDLLLTNDEK